MQARVLPGAARYPKQTWRAWHVFARTPAALDRLLVEAVVPEMSLTSATDAFFFLRYWENGPHLRLRWRDDDDMLFLARGERLAAAAAAVVAAYPDGPERFGTGMRYDSWHVDPAGLPWFAPGAVVEVPYEAELRRYGGAAGLRLHERWFAESSALALRIVVGTQTDAAKRESIALALTAAVIADALEADEVQPFLQGMAGAWRGMTGDPALLEERARRQVAQSGDAVAALLRPLGAGRGNPVVEVWRSGVRGYLVELESLQEQSVLLSPLTGTVPIDFGDRRAAMLNMLFSQIHMNNNRLGITPAQEFCFAMMLLAALEQAAA